MKTLIAVGIAALALAACEPVHNVQRHNTCAFAGIDGVDTRECATLGSGVYNIAKGTPATMWHNPNQTVHWDAKPSKHMIHGKVHMHGCPNGGTKAHYHNGKLYHRVCK